MWPQILQMSEDDCRSTLRRIELETYANVIGAFRAQGGLNDKKVKLLEELRSVFHISQDRHRAEARRVANDEHLSTIAKVVSGPNTWQEWSREGRRPYPMLPRVAPQTALGWIANNLATEAAQENAKLPYPTETAAAAMEEQTAIFAAKTAAEANGFRYPEKYVITSDPFKMPDIPSGGIKKNLKRGLNDAQNMVSASLSKKRHTNDTASFTKQKQVSVTAATSPVANSRKAISSTKLEQQRFFYQQQQKAKKLAKAASKREKAPSANKSGRKWKKLKEQHNQQLIQGEELQQQHELMERSYENQMIQKLCHLDQSTNNTNIIADVAQQHQHIEGDIQSDQKESQYTNQQKSFYTPLMVPQIAASKRDISRNLTKLQLPGQMGTSSRISGHIEAGQNPPNVGSSVVLSNKTVIEGKLTPLSTPVQKYIVEDRQPPISVCHQTPTVATASLSPSSTQQVPTSQYSTLSTSNKVRTLNTTILPPGTKLSASAKKLSGATILSATVLSPGSTSNSPLGENMGNAHTTSQVYNLHDGNCGTSGNINAGGISSSGQQQLSAPTHTPPAVIQLHSNEVVRVGSHQSTIGTASTQSKVLTTKLLPIVLSGKGDSAKNGAATIVSSASIVTNSGTTSSNIIKNLSSTMFVSNQQGVQTGGSSVFQSFSSTGQVYRKHPNILKSTSSVFSRNPLAFSGGPQILSNIRVAPPITTATTSNSSFPLQTQSNIFQQQLRTGAGSSTSGIRTSVKICQSPNGKVFIQPANLDTSKLTKLPSGHISQRILPGTLLGTSANLGGTNVTSGVSGSLSSNQPGSPHRIAIQKVQIIPAPLSSNVLGSPTQSQQTTQQPQPQQQPQQRLGTSSLTIGTGGVSIGKGNFFVPRSAKNPATITLSKAAFPNALSGPQSELLASSVIGNVSAKQHSDIVSKPSNVVVIDATSTASKILPHHQKLSSLVSGGNTSRPNLDSSQMITEDTPVDIIVENSANIVGEPSPVTESSSITAVLSSNIVDDGRQLQQKATTTTTPKQSTSMVPITVLNATDWEMELDQATAANLTHNQRNESNMVGISDSLSGQFNHKIQQQQQPHVEQIETADTIIIDDSFEDVIIEEEEHEDTVTENEHYNAQDEDMEIETSGDEIIMVDNVTSLDARLQFDNMAKKTNLSSEIKVNSRPITEQKFEDTEYISDDNIRVSLESENTEEEKRDNPQDFTSEDNTMKILASNPPDVTHDTAKPLADNIESKRATDITNEIENVVCNNHEKEGDLVEEKLDADNLNVGHEENDSNVSEQQREMNSAEVNDATTITAVSASLYSVKSVQDQEENLSKVQVEPEEQRTFECSQEAHFVGNKNDGLQATDQ